MIEQEYLFNKLGLRTVTTEITVGLLSIQELMICLVSVITSPHRLICCD